MGLMDNFKVRAALAKHQRGDTAGARREYEALMKDGILKPSFMLPYSVLLLRDDTPESYAKVKGMLARIQRSPELSKEDRPQLLANYSVADYKLGNLDKALKLLEASHRERPCGLTYQTLGYLYVVAGDLDKALAYNQEALDYDDEDSICLDNMAQTLYSLKGDKAAAKPYFDKANEIKPGQIDTLWFLSRYDLDEGNTAAAIEKLETALEGRFSPLNHVNRDQVEQEIARLKQDAPA